ncbi:hypothetical protein ACI2IY_11080 [Lysobacter enzymogenes]|uniref:hypothetical protein n=1 Tax=Lysobacter enzymogenes TaxID=69 RepID=UPI00384E19D3
MTAVSGFSRWLAAFAAIGVLASTWSAQAQTEPLPPRQPFPTEYREYFEQVFAADAIADDEARCKAMPDLPGNRWLPGAAQARCSLLRAPAWSLERMEKLLKRGKGGAAELDAGFARLLEEHYQDPAQREQIFRAFQFFDESARAGDLAQRWIRAAPESAFAHVALASHYLAAGEQVRGTTAVGEVPEERLQLMRDKFDQAVPLYAKALVLEPRLSVACVDLIAIGRHVSNSLEENATRQCMQIDPYSYYVVYARITSAEPKWGGSMAQLREAVAYAAANAERNPILGALAAEADGYEAAWVKKSWDSKDWDPIARIAPSGTLMNWAGETHRNRMDNWPGLVLAAQAVRFWPHRPSFRIGRVDALLNLGYYDIAMRDLQQILRDAPGDATYYETLIYVLERTQGRAATRPYLLRMAELSKPARLGAMYRYCETFLLEQSDAKRGEACIKDFDAEFAGSVESRALRVRALHLRSDPDATAATRAFLEAPRSEANWLIGVYIEFEQWQIQAEEAQQNKGRR